MHKTGQDLSGSQEVPESRSDLRGNNADGTCKLALRVEDRGTDPDSIVDIFSAGNGVAVLADLFNSSRRSSGRTCGNAWSWMMMVRKYSSMKVGVCHAREDLSDRSAVHIHLVAEFLDDLLSGSGPSTFDHKAPYCRPGSRDKRPPLSALRAASGYCGQHPEDGSLWRQPFLKE